MATEILTLANITKAKPQAKPVRMFDGGGLYLEISPAGGKLWRFKYRFAGKEKRLSLGAWPDVSLTDARARHREARALLAATPSIDPGARQQAAKAAEKAPASVVTFKQQAQAWLAMWSVGKSERHVGYVSRRLDADIYPAIGDLPIDQVASVDVVRTIKAIAERECHDLAKRAHQTISQVFRHAVAHGMAQRNPAADFRPGDVIATPSAANYARIDAKELPAFLKAVSITSMSVPTRCAIELLMHTFVRTSELIGARWDEIDRDAKQWRIPGARMKMKSEHIVPLSRQALAILDRLKAWQERYNQSEYLFPSQITGGKNPVMSNNTILKVIETAGFKHKMTGHGARGLASTILHEQQFDHQHIELQLAHQERNKVSASYNHALYLPQRVAMLQSWSDYLDKCTKPD
jgi:integrase